MSAPPQKATVDGLVLLSSQKGSERITERRLRSNLVAAAALDVETWGRMRWPYLVRVESWPRSSGVGLGGLARESAAVV
jgi:hypothetical protein